MKITTYRIYDWAGNIIEDVDYNTFDDAESRIEAVLGDDYDTYRQEYEIKEIVS